MDLLGGKDSMDAPPHRKEEAKQSFLEMVKISKENPHLFTPDDLKKIEMNTNAFTKVPGPAHQLVPAK
jgi:hypothetical protein